MGQMTSASRLYLGCMTEMKGRLFAASDGMDKYINSGHTENGDFEFACLQLRKAIELVGFSAMTAEIDAYRAIRAKFQREWNFAEILKNLRRISPNCFPFRVRIKRSDQVGVKWHLVPEKSYAITPDQLKNWHGLLNEHLHAMNPYRASEDHLLVSLRVKSNVTDILSMLAEHCFLRSDNSGGFLISLNERNQPVTVIEFEANSDVH